MKKLIILTLIAILSIYYVNNNEYIEIPNNSIRFRIIANSNSNEDIKNKVTLKNNLTKEIVKLTKNSSNTNESLSSIIENDENIKKSIEKILSENNIKESYSVNIGKNYFPEKVFKGIKYNAGNYNSYVITLGKGEGDNFWCVLFPPICGIDDSKNEYEYRSIIKELLKKYN